MNQNGSQSGPGAPAAAKAPKRPRRIGKLILISVSLVVFIAILLINGYVSGQFNGESPTTPPAGRNNAVPKSVVAGGPVIDPRSEPVRSYPLKAKTLALTFDDGPDPDWTPKVLDVLRRNNVPATFFVVGSLSAQHPGLLEDIRATGSEIGIHTFSNVDLATVDADRSQREMTQSQLVLSGATGETSFLVRPPFSASVAAVDNTRYQVIHDLGQQGYVTALSDLDSKDWQQQTNAAAIVKNSTPAGGKSAIVTLHDAGGDRSQTIAALATLIPQLKAQGYTFTTVTKAAGLGPANQPAQAKDKTVGKGLLIAVAVSNAVVTALEWLLIVAGVLVFLRLILLVIFACYHAWRRKPKRWSWGPPITMPVSVIVPAYNEKECIAATVRSLMASDYPIEILVVDDGSTDETAAIVEAMGLPQVRLIRQENGGKPSALNNGIRNARSELIVMIDGDTVFEPSTIRLLVQPFADPRVGAVSGNAKVANRTKMIGRWQHIEYVIGFNTDRRVADMLGCITTIPGAVGAFRRTALRQVGGVSEDTLAEDTDLTMAICAAGWKVVYEERARAWTEAPESLQQLWRQRYRWSYGTMQSMWKHRGAVFAGGPAGRMGRVGLFNLALFQVLLPVLAPLIDVFLIYGLIFLNPVNTVLLWLAVLGIQVLCGIIAFSLEGEKIWPVFAMPLQQLVYRQMMYSVLIKSIGTALAGARLRWQKLKRVGDFGGMSGAPAPMPTAPMPARMPVPSAAPHAPAGYPGQPGQAPMPGYAAPGRPGPSGPVPAQRPMPPTSPAPQPAGRYPATPPTQRPAGGPPGPQPGPNPNFRRG